MRAVVRALARAWSPPLGRPVAPVVLHQLQLTLLAVLVRLTRPRRRP